MTRARVAAQQAARPPKPARLVRGTVSAVSPLTVQLAGGGAVGGLAVPGATYTVGGLVYALVQEPGVGPVFPIPGSTALAALAGYVPTTAFSALPTITNPDTAPDGFAVVAAANSPAGATSWLETFTATISASTWRFQQLRAENGGPVYVRRQWQGAWAAWSDGSTSGAVANAGTRTDWQAGANMLTRSGPLVALRYEINVGATPPVAGTVLGTIPVGFRPSGTLWPIGVLFNGGLNNQTFQATVDTDGTIVLNSSSVAVAANHGLFLNITYTGA